MITTMTDWRGVEIKVGDTVVYPVRHGSSMWMVEGEIVELHPIIDRRWNTAMKRLDLIQVGGVTVERRRDSYDEKVDPKRVKVGFKRLTVVATKVVPNELIRTYGEYRERYGTGPIEIDERAS